MKKKLSILLVLCVILCNVAFANGENFIEAYGIMDVESSDINVTRAEMAQFIVNMLNLKNVEAGVREDEEFSDVADEHWAYDAIHIAKRYKVVEGYGDNKFGHEDYVTYEQAVKMLVSVLGYDSKANEKGGYSIGYTITASEIGLTTGVSFITTDNATRENIAKLISNAVKLPVMEQTVFGKEPDYEIMNGKDGNPYITFFDKYFGK